MIGTVLDGRYEILELLGEGARATVYKARHLLMKRLVAVKVLRADLAGDAASLKRFEKEARAASGLEHTNIVTVYDFGVSQGGEPYLVMDYVPGVSLAHVLSDEKRLPALRVSRIISQCCRALAYAHEKGLVHRGLEPSNIMLADLGDQHDCVKLVDFGIAKFLAQPATQEHSSGGLAGAPEYMSPEQCMGRDLDKRSDIYSAGCIAYQALAGKPPFTGETAVEIASRHLKEEPQSFKAIDEQLRVPPRLEKAVFKALEKKPEHRFQNMGELERAFSLDTQVEPDSHCMSRQVSDAGAVARSGKILLILVLIPLVVLAFGYWLLGTANGSLTVAKMSLAIAESLTPYDTARIERLGRSAAEIYERNGQWQDAANEYVKLIDYIGKKEKADRTRLLDLKGRAAILFARAGDLNAARKWGRDAALAIKEEGKQALHKRDAAAAAIYYARCAEILEHIEPAYDQELDDTYERLVVVGGLLKPTDNLSYWQKKSVDLRLKYLGPDDRHTGEALWWLGEAYLKENKLDEAEKVLNEALRISKRDPGIGFTHTTLWSLSRLYLARKDYDRATRYTAEAVESLKAAPRENVDELAVLTSDLAARYSDLKKWPQAQQAYGDAIKLVARLRPVRADWVCNLWKIAADVDINLGRLKDAGVKYTQSLKYAELAMLPSRQVDALTGLSNVQRGLKQFKEAEASDRQAVKIMQKSRLAKGPAFVSLEQQCGYDLIYQKKTDEAIVWFKKAQRHALRQLPPEDRFFAQNHEALSTIYFEQGNYLEAESNARQALSAAKRMRPADNVVLFRQYLHLARALCAERRFVEAETTIKKAETVGLPESERDLKSEMLRVYSRLAEQTGRTEKSKQLAAEAARLEAPEKQSGNTSRHFAR